MKRKNLFRFFKYTAIIAITSLYLTGCKKDNHVPETTYPSVITFSSTSLYPESIAYDSKNENFIVGSIKHGTLGIVDLKGNYTELPGDPTWVSTFGIKISGDFAYICVADLGNSLKSSSTTATRLAKVVKYDLRSRSISHTYDLTSLFSGPIFSNDMAIDDSNNIYITESLSGLIYKIDNAGIASIFIDSNLFKGDGFNLNGIVYDKAGYLLVDKTNDGSLFRIDINNRSISTVALSAPLTGSDGLLLNGGNLYVVNYLSGLITALSSADNWQSARVVSTFQTEVGSTAVTTVENNVYVLNAKVTEIVNDPATALSSTYTISQYLAGK